VFVKAQKFHFVRLIFAFTCLCKAVVDCDEPVPAASAELNIHVFQLSDSGPANETVGGDGNGEEEVTTCSQWVLPAAEFDGLWENLIYDNTIKR